MDIKSELSQIQKLINSANQMKVIKKEVSKAMDGALVIGGEFSGEHTEKGKDYDVVVVHNASDEGVEAVTRRLKAQNMKIENLDTMTEKLIGIKYARRGK